MNTVPPTILAFGAWLKNAACLWQPGQPAHWSAIHGDLSDPQACEALRHSVAHMVGDLMAKGRRPDAIAHDLHPDFFSTRLALETADQLGVPAIGVQHHHAHIGAAMATHRLNEPVIGLALDGVGLGTDGTAWGGEMLYVDGHRWERLGHLSHLALPGGDKAAREPWRVAASALHALGRGDEIAERLATVSSPAAARTVSQMLDKGLNCPPTSSAGRWFDAAASALRICQHQQDEAEAAIALEKAAAMALEEDPDILAIDGVTTAQDGVLDLRHMWAQLLDAPTRDIGRLAAGFHLALAEGLADWAIQAARMRQVKAVALAGGCFFNRILRERLHAQLSSCGLRVYLQTEQGFGDAGLAIGQAWVAAQQMTGQPDAVVTTRKEPHSCV
ncbi:carbamoyltransferase HypF [Hydrogenophaga sp. 5NK40-0174]|uniref:Kae1-like domain-containing protein n=1 Tax=Hydrogenophaga sp. 5NK40-0174 TaxID=3127649 RepID=UPI0031076ED1